MSESEAKKMTVFVIVVLIILIIVILSRKPSQQYFTYESAMIFDGSCDLVVSGSFAGEATYEIAGGVTKNW